jgi:hypothetical protein
MTDPFATTDPLKALLDSGVLDTSAFPPNSRYHKLEVKKLEQLGQDPIAYLKRRFVPSPDRFATVQEHRVSQGDRIDNLAAKYLGDPELYWRLCDANGALRPDDLTRTPGQTLRITLPEDVPGESND